MNKIISGVEYENGHVTGVTISGIVEVGEDEPVTAFFRREEHGRWDDRGFHISCSVCGHSAFLGTKDPVIHKSEKANLKFCPHCGAKMDLKNIGREMDNDGRTETD